MGHPCRITVEVDSKWAIQLAVALLLLPLKWLIPWLVAALVHELFHCICVLACGGSILQVYVGAVGAVIRTDLENTGKELLALLAGPAGALLLLGLSGTFPRIAVCAFLQTAYNLLPLPELDGGQVLFRIGLLFGGHSFAGQLCTFFEYYVMLVLVLLALLGCIVFHLGFYPVLLVGFLLLRRGKINISCKQSLHAVQ